MIKKITAFTHHTTAEGERVSFTYAVIDEDGKVVTGNERATLILVDDKILSAVKQVNDFLQTKIPN